MGEHAQGGHAMFYEGFVHLLNNFLNFILSPSDQPRKFIIFAVVILLVNVLAALTEWTWGRGISFTVLALLAGAISAYISVVALGGMRRYLEMELTEPQSWASFGFSIAMVYWYLLELPIIFSLGVGAVILAALSRQRGWIIGNAVALALTVVASLLALWLIPDIQAGVDIFNPLAVHDRDVQRFQAYLAFVVVLLAIQLLYLAYGVWRIWRSRAPGSRSRSATSLPSVQS
jgi:hypothetical protein